jgi:hypothetical protein
MNEKEQKKISKKKPGSIDPGLEHLVLYYRSEFLISHLEQFSADLFIAYAQNINKFCTAVARH